jgi:hypothetical protein
MEDLLRQQDVAQEQDSRDSSQNMLDEVLRDRTLGNKSESQSAPPESIPAMTLVDDTLAYATSADKVVPIKDQTGKGQVYYMSDQKIFETRDNGTVMRFARYEGPNVCAVGSHNRQTGITDIQFTEFMDKCRVIQGPNGTSVLKNGEEVTDKDERRTIMEEANRIKQPPRVIGRS